MTPNATIFQVIVGMLLQKLCWLSIGWSYYNSMPERRGTTPNMLQHIGMKEECRKPDLRCEKLTLQSLMYDGENKCIKYNQCTSEVMGGKQNQVVNRTEWLLSQELTVVQYLESDKGII